MENYKYTISNAFPEPKKESVDYSKLKPFDYEKAKAGAPVVTCSGSPITQIAKFDVSDEWNIRGVLRGHVEAFRESDLRMASVKKTIDFFVNAYGPRYDGSSKAYAYAHNTEQAANQASAGSGDNRLGGKAHKVTIEYEE